MTRFPTQQNRPSADPGGSACSSFSGGPRLDFVQVLAPTFLTLCTWSSPFSPLSVSFLICTWGFIAVVGIQEALVTLPVGGQGHCRGNCRAWQGEGVLRRPTLPSEHQAPQQIPGGSPWAGGSGFLLYSWHLGPLSPEGQNPGGLGNGSSSHQAWEESQLCQREILRTAPCPRACGPGSGNLKARRGLSSCQKLGHQGHLDLGAVLTLLWKLGHMSLHEPHCSHLSSKLPGHFTEESHIRCLAYPDTS